MPANRLLVLGTLLFATMRTTAAEPLPAPLGLPTANVAVGVPPQPTPFVMTIANGLNVSQIVWVPDNGTWHSYKVVPDCPSPRDTSACGAEGSYVRHHSRPTPSPVCSWSAHPTRNSRAGQCGPRCGTHGTGSQSCGCSAPDSCRR